MNHNQQVHQNIQRIRDEVDSAESQRDLTNILVNIDSHKGKLDYKNPLLGSIKWSLLMLGLMAFVLIVLRDRTITANTIAHYVVDDSAYWFPVVLATIILCFKWERTTSRLVFWSSFAAAATLLAICFVHSSTWSVLYWTVFLCLSKLISFIIVLILAQGSHQDDSYHHSYHHSHVDTPISFGAFDFGAQFAFSITLLVSGGILWLVLKSKNNWRSKVSTQMFFLSTIFQNGLQKLATPEWELSEFYKNNFMEFRRGDNETGLPHERFLNNKGSG